MKLSTYLNALEEIKGRLPEGIDPEVTFTVLFCMVIACSWIT